MSAELVILVLLIVTALAFDFTNGFHDTGNAMATSIATGALKPKTAVLLAGVLNLIGAFLSVEVAVTVTTSVLKVQDSAPGPCCPGSTPRPGSPSSSPAWSAASCEPADLAVRHPVEFLARAVRRADRRRAGALGLSGVNWSGVTAKVLVPAVAAPLIACLVAGCGTWLVYRLTRNVAERRRKEGFRWGQIATASLVALSHGTNDAQKTMGVIALALITTGHLTVT
jgi:PiT family inorganic phosphate transporter